MLLTRPLTCDPLAARKTRFVDYYRSIGSHESILVGEYFFRLLDVRPGHYPSLHHVQFHLGVERDADGASAYHVPYLGRV